MKVIALVSGGKDSCFSMMEVTRLGHEVVAVANLCPLDPSCEDVDSHLLQTAAHSLVPLLASCLPFVPCFRRPLHGSSRSTELVYDVSVSGDEVADLELLLRTVCTALPHANAVCSGALLSNYQRIRVEHVRERKTLGKCVLLFCKVCEKLGLVSIAPLWERDQRSLLREMVLDRGVRAVLVKVASMGLLPSKHLGKDLSDLLPLLDECASKYGSSVCGEGGEYESFVLDCPLFANRIQIDSTQIIAGRDPIAPEGLLRVLEARVVAKTLDGVVVPQMYPIVIVEGDLKEAKKQDNVAIKGVDDEEKLVQRVWESQDQGFVQQIVLRSSSAEALCRAVAALQPLVFVEVYTPDMSSFKAWNSVYGQALKGLAMLPARAVVEPCKALNYLEVHVVRGRIDQSLRVQSWSFWAPACIGPYSQAVRAGPLCFLAGQIGLVPERMDLSAEESPAMCLKHATASSDRCGGTAPLAAIVYHVPEEMERNLPASLMALWIRVAALPRGAKVEIVGLSAAVVLREEWTGTTIAQDDQDVLVEIRSSKSVVIMHVQLKQLDTAAQTLERLSSFPNRRLVHQRLFVVKENVPANWPVNISVNVEGFSHGVVAAATFVFE